MWKSIKRKYGNIWNAGSVLRVEYKGVDHGKIGLLWIINAYKRNLFSIGQAKGSLL